MQESRMEVWEVEIEEVLVAKIANLAGWNTLVAMLAAAASIATRKLASVGYLAIVFMCHT